MENKIERYAEKLDGISYTDWIRVKCSVDKAFDKQKKELDKNIQLSAENFISANRSLFGSEQD